VKLRGLLPNAHYTIEGVKGVYSGDYLMQTGIEIPLRDAFKSRIFKIRKS